MLERNVYFFSKDNTDGNKDLKETLGGKGANLAEMCNIGLPIPPGFTVTTDVCKIYYANNKSYPQKIKTEVEENLLKIEKLLGKKLGDPNDPLLVSVRSGAAVSMPGMMDTVLNLGLNDESVKGLAKVSKNEWFAYDSYRRFIQMYGDVVLGMKPENDGDEDPFEVIIEEVKKKKNIESDSELSIDDLKLLISNFKEAVKKVTGKNFPIDPMEQLWGGIDAVFNSWNTDRAVYYRRLNQIPEDLGTAVNVQTMVYGNMGNTSGTGVAFTRDAATGENLFNGEYLINAQGEDVVAGTRTPQEITKEGSLRWAKLQNVSESERASKFSSLEEAMPEMYKELFEMQKKLEDYYKDMQDLEFTIQDGKMWILQTRSGKRTGGAMIKIAIDMMKEGMIDEKTAILRVEPNKLNELLHPEFDKVAIDDAVVLTRGLPASPGAATGQIVFSADDAEKWAEDGKETILVRTETSPEDLKGMNVANGILTARGGMTSHAAVVARGMGKCCISGAGKIRIDYKAKTMKIGDDIFKEGDWISLNGTSGEVYNDKIKTIDPQLSGYFGQLMELADKYTRMNVRTNADTPHDAEVARKFGAQGIGLCRTEHMFFEGDRIIAMREMILAEDEAGRIKALEKLLPIQRADFEGIFAAMHDLPVTVRLLDPPLHEFVPHDEKGQKEMADVMGVSIEDIKDKIESLSEVNPMLGHRGCRLGNTYPEITVMQARAIIEAALNLKKKGIKAIPEIMIPLIGTKKEFKMQENIVRDTIKKVFAERGDEIEFLVGTMIEIPRAALIADEVAADAEFFSFGTNDLTQMTFGYSRDDAGKFLQIYIEKGLLKNDPFQVLDQTGVGQLVKMGTEKGRSVRPDLKVGICGEHGGEPNSVEFCDEVGMNYVSCSPFRVPIARLAAAQANIKKN